MTRRRRSPRDSGRTVPGGRALRSRDRSSARRGERRRSARGAAQRVARVPPRLRTARRALLRAVHADPPLHRPCGRAHRDRHRRAAGNGRGRLRAVAPVPVHRPAARRARPAPYLPPRRPSGVRGRRRGTRCDRHRAPGADSRLRAPAATCAPFPLSGSSSPARMRRSVDLPAPFGPTRPMRLTGGTTSVTSCKTSCAAWCLVMLAAARVPPVGCKRGTSFERRTKRCVCLA